MEKKILVERKIFSVIENIKMKQKIENRIENILSDWEFLRKIVIGLLIPFMLSTKINCFFCIITIFKRVKWTVLEHSWIMFSGERSIDDLQDKLNSNWWFQKSQGRGSYEIIRNEENWRILGIVERSLRRKQSFVKQACPNFQQISVDSL